MNSPFDIAVVGSGSAGIAAAIVAARAGARTLLMDRRPAAGGIGGFSGLTTLCGLHDDSGRLLNDGFSPEFAEALAEGPPVSMGKVWVLLYRPEHFRELAAKLIAATPNLTAAWNTSIEQVTCDGDSITHLNSMPVRAVIDCSGTAEVARAIGAECLATDEQTQAPAVVFPLHGIECELSNVIAATQVLLPLARAGFPPLNFQPHPEPNSITVKFSGRADQVPALLDFLRANIAGFERSRTSSTEFQSSPRAGRMIIGQYLLTGEDVLAAREFPDAIARCAWPIEQWNAAGACRLRHLPPGQHYEIPARSLRAARVPNLFMAGKTLSADADAIASARVMGCCLATGAAAGNLAAAFVGSPGKAEHP